MFLKSGVETIKYPSSIFEMSQFCCIVSIIDWYKYGLWPLSGQSPLKENKLYGYNTDYFGFGATFERKGISFKGKTAVILGAGGACKAALSYIETLYKSVSVPFW